MCKLESVLVPSCSHQPAAWKKECFMACAPAPLQPSCMSWRAFCMCGSRHTELVYLALCVPSPCTCVGPWEGHASACVCVCVCARACALARAPYAQVAGGVSVCVEGAGARDARSGLGLVGGGGGGAAQSGSASRLRVRVVAELGSGDSRARIWGAPGSGSPAASPRLHSTLPAFSGPCLCHRLPGNRS